MLMNIQIPRRVWIEAHDVHESDACDVIVEMDTGQLYSAVFVTIPYLQRQMQLSYVVSKQLADVPQVRYTALETPHILVEDLSRDTIEDTIDNLIALDTFESLFTLVQDITEEEAAQAGTRATKEMAAVVLPAENH